MQESIIIAIGSIATTVISILGTYFKLKNKFSSDVGDVKESNKKKFTELVKAINKENSKRDNRQDYLWNLHKLNLEQRKSITNDPEEIAKLTKQIDTMIEIGD